VRIFRTAVFICLLTVSLLATTLTSGAATYQSFGTWSLGVTNTGLSTTAINTSDTSTLNNGWKVTVSVSGDGVGIYNDRSETLATRGGTTSMFVSGVSTAASAIALMTMCPASCSAGGSGKRAANVGTYTFSFTDASGNPIQVVNPVLNISGIGGNNGGVALWSDLTLTNPGMTMTQLASNGNMQVVGGTVLQPVNATSTQTCSAAPIAACGSVMVLGTASSFSFQAGYNSAPGLGTFSGDAFDFLMSVGSTFDLTYNANFPAGSTSSGAVPGSQLSNAQGATPSVAANAATLLATGYTPTGWCTVATTPGQTCASAGGVSYAYSSSLSPMASDVVLYEMWSPNTNTVTFNSSSGSSTGTMSPESFTTGVTAPLTTDTFGLSGYFFTGWCSVAVSPGATCTGTIYLDAASFSTNQNLTLYAQWLPISTTFTLTYNANPPSGITVGGTVPSTVTGIAYQSTTTPVTPDTLTATGYLPAGWCTVAVAPGAACTGTAYTTGNLSSVVSNVVLYARWSPNTFNITFNANGGTETVTTQQFSYQVAQNLSANTMANSGNSFAGWCTVVTTIGQSCASAGGTLYAAGASFSASGPTTLYAVWSTASTYIVNVYNNTGCGNGYTTGATTPAGSTPLISSFGSSTVGTCANYVFAGWCTTQPTPVGTPCPGSSTLYANSATPLAAVFANVNLYATWTLVLSLTYVVNNPVGSITGSVPPAVTGLSVGATPAVAAVGNMALSGYAFTGWNTASNGTGTAYSGAGDATLAAMAASVILYGQWTALLTLSFNPTIGLNSGGVPANITAIIPGTNVTLPGNSGSMVANGYVFGGWCTTTVAAGGACGGTAYQGGSLLSSMTANKTLYAIWTTAYTVTYFASWKTTGAVPAAQTGNLAGATPAVVGNTGSLTFTNYVFGGWCTANITYGVACSGTTYQDGATLPAMNANVNLYVIWTPLYSVIYHNGYTATSGTLPANVTGLMPGSTPTVSGNTGNVLVSPYTFAGWCTANISATAACSGTTYQGGAVLPAMNANVDLYAIWGFTVTYVANYPAATTDTGSVPPAQAVAGRSTPAVSANTGYLTATGYKFLGWCSVAVAAGGTCSGTLYPVASPGSLPSVTANVTLYANWATSTTYTITYNANFPASTTDTGTVPSPQTGLVATTTALLSANSGTLAVVGWTFSGWNTLANGTGTSYAATGSTAFTVPAANTTLYAVWTPSTYVLTLTQVGSGGVTSTGAPTSGSTITTTVPGSATQTYNYNTSVVMTATPATGYTFTGWSGACTNTTGTCTVAMTAAASVTATFTVTTYALALTQIGSGGVTSTGAPSSGSTITTSSATTVNQTYNYNTSVVLTAAPATGWNFTGWSGGTCTGSASTCTVVMTAAKSVTATFTIQTFPITVTQTSNGTISTGSVTVNYLAGQAYTFAPATGYQVASITVNGVALAGSALTSAIASGYTFSNVTSAQTLTATYSITTNVLTLTQVGSGAVSSTGTPTSGSAIATSSPSSTTQTYNYNTSVVLTAAPATGWVFNGWSGACTNATGTCTVAMTAAKSVTATFTITTNVLTLTQVGSGGVTSTGTPATGSGVTTTSASTTTGTYNYNTSVVLTATPATGWVFTGWTGACTGSAATCTVSVTAAASVSATFTITTNVLTLTQVGSGGVTSTGAPTSGSTIATTTASTTTATYNYNTSVVLTAAPATGYSFTGWTGACTNATGTCTVAMTAAKSVTATFVIQTFPITVTQTSNGTISTGSVTVNYGAGQAYTFSPATGYQVASVTVNGTALNSTDLATATSSGYTFSNVTSAQTITATYSPISYTVTYVLGTATGYVGGPSTPTGSVPTQSNLNYGAVFSVASATNSMAATNYTFGGWSNGSTIYQPGTNNYTMPAANVTFTAVWVPVGQDVINFVANPPVGSVATGAPSVASIVGANNTTVSSLATVGTLAVTGYTFGGWSTTPGGTTPVTAQLLNSPTISLYAIWTIKTYPLAVTQVGLGTVISSPAGISLSSATNASANYNYNTSVTLTASPATGYSFTGWTQYCSGSSATCTVPMTQAQSVTATFAVNNYSVTYVSGGGTGSVPTQGNVNFASTFSVAANSLTKPGYTFAGWSNATTTVQPGTNNYTMPAANVTLTALWTPNATDTLVFNSNAPTGTTLTGTPSIASTTGLDGVTIASSSFATVGTMAVTGYTFAGWASTPTGTTPLTSQLLNATSVSVYAIWTPNTLTVTFTDPTMGGGSGTQPFTTGVAQALDPVAFSTANATFVGWATSASSQTVVYANLQSITISTSMTLYAVWTLSVSYNANIPSGASSTGSAPATVANIPMGTSALAVAANPNSLAATGFIFEGWATSPGATVPAYPVAAPGILPVITQNVVLYAIWYSTQPPFSVVYVANTPASATVVGAVPDVVTGVMPAATDVSVAANPKSLAATDYTLLGWATTPTATTPDFPVSNPGTLPAVTAPVVLFAVWSRVAAPAPPSGGGGGGVAVITPLTVTYSIGKGTGTTPSTQTVNPNDSVTIDSGVTITPPAGLEFTNWACGGGTTSPASKVTVTTSFTCIAQYSPLHYTLSYVANFPAGSVSSGTAPATQTGLLYGATPSVATSAMLSATKYVFAGWATSPSAMTATYSATGPATLDPLTGNVTLYAVWKEQAVSPSTPYLLGVVFYALDKWGTTEKGYMATVRAVAQQIVAGSYHTITITGSADIRGSVRWNHILGVNRATTAMNTLKKVLATLHYTQVRFKLVNLNVSTKYAGYNLNRRATFIGIAGQ